MDKHGLVLTVVFVFMFSASQGCGSSTNAAASDVQVQPGPGVDAAARAGGEETGDASSPKDGLACVLPTGLAADYQSCAANGGSIDLQNRCTVSYTATSTWGEGGFSMRDPADVERWLACRCLGGDWGSLDPVPPNPSNPNPSGVDWCKLTFDPPNGEFLAAGVCRITRTTRLCPATYDQAAKTATCAGTLTDATGSGSLALRSTTPSTNCFYLYDGTLAGEQYGDDVRSYCNNTSYTLTTGAYPAEPFQFSSLDVETLCP
jgi:hypothetical protein